MERNDMDVDDLYDFHNKYDVRDDGSPGMWDHSSSSEGDRFQMDLARIQNQPNLGEQKMMIHMMKHLGFTEQQAKYQIDLAKVEQTSIAPQIHDTGSILQSLPRQIQDKRETTYIIACHGGPAENYGAPPVGKFNVDDINFNTLVDDGVCLSMARGNLQGGPGSIQRWINETNQAICDGFSKLYSKKGNYNDRYLSGNDEDFNAGIYKCGSDIPIFNFDDPSFKINYAKRFLGREKMGKPMVSPPIGIYKLSDIIEVIKSYHSKSLEKSNRIKIVGAFCCGGFPNQGEVLAGIMDGLKIKQATKPSKKKATKPSKKETKGKIKQAKKPSKKKAKKQSKNKLMDGKLGIAPNKGIGKQKASKAKKSKKIKKVKSKNKKKKSKK
jgi:hypothetical protein